MKCLSCEKEVPADMKLCGYCGKPMPQSTDAGPPPAEKEEDVWRGGFSARAMLHEWLLWILFTGALLYVRRTLLPEDVLWTWVAWGAIGLPFLFIAGRLFYRKIAIRYRLTTERFFRRRGIVLQTTDELDLHRVDDFEVRQNLFQRMLGVGTIVIDSPTDKSHPTMTLRGIAGPTGVKEKMREHVRRLRKSAFRMEQI